MSSFSQFILTSDHLRVKQRTGLVNPKLVLLMYSWFDSKQMCAATKHDQAKINNILQQKRIRMIMVKALTSSIVLIDTKLGGACATVSRNWVANPLPTGNAHRANIPVVNATWRVPRPKAYFARAYKQDDHIKGFNSFTKFCVITTGSESTSHIWVQRNVETIEFY
jgi:hypothetical protein